MSCRNRSQGKNNRDYLESSQKEILKADVLHFVFIFTGSNPYLTSSLREDGDHELCTDPVDSGSYVHKLEKRSFLPPVTCTKDHELGAVRAKVHCQPRPRLVRLPWPNDTSVHKVR